MIGNDWVVRYDNRCFQIERQSRHAPARADVLVCEGRDGSIAIEYRGGKLDRKEIPAPVQPKPAKEKPADKEVTGRTSSLGPKGKRVPPPDHPWRRAARLGAGRRARKSAAAATQASLARHSASP